MTIAPLSTVSIRRLVLLAVLLGVLASGCRQGPKPDLEVGKPVEREIAGTETHTYRLPLAAGSYLALRIWQPSLDVTARLVGPHGESTPVFDDPGGIESPDRLVLTVPRGGVYRLVVRAKSPRSPRGRYRLDVRELRGSRSGDADRVAAEREYEAGRRAVEADGAQSLPRLQNAFRLWEKAGARQELIDPLIQIANGIDSAPPDALKHSQQALALALEAEWAAEEARAFQAVGNAFVANGQTEEAVGAFQRSLAISRKLRDDRQLGLTLYALGRAAYQQHQLDRALAPLDEARRVLTRWQDFAPAANAMITISSIWLDRGETSNAQKACEEARRLAGLLPAGVLAVDASVHFCFGKVGLTRGDLENARTEFSEVLRINQERKDPNGQAFAHQALGSVYFNLGEPDTALSQYRQALPYFQDKDENTQARILTNIGWMYQSKGNPTQALAYYRQAQSIYRKEQSPSGLDLALHDTGVAYASLGRPQAGLAALQTALELRTKAGARKAQAATLLEIATVYQSLGKLGLAEDSYRRTLALAQKVENASLQAECLFRWAALESSQKRLPAAREKSRQSLEIVESLRNNVLSDKLKTSFFASKRSYYELYMDLLMSPEGNASGPDQEAALDVSERARSRSLLDLIAEGNINVRQGIDPVLKQQEVELGARLSKFQDKLGRAGPAEAAALEQQLDEVQRNMVELESRIRSQHQHYAEVRYPTPLNLKEIQALLDERTALLQYFTAQNGSFLFVVTRQGLQSYRLPPREDLAGEVKAIRSALQERGKRQRVRYQNLAARLYSELIAPAAGALSGKDRLLIAPDGPLYLLPFEALLTDAKASGDQGFRDLPYLLRRFAVSYIPSASVLRGLRAARPAPANGRAAKRFVGFADPMIPPGMPAAPDMALMTRGSGSQAGEPRLERLTESGREVERIAKLFPPSTVALYTGASATEDNVKANAALRTARQVDFATHGVLNEARPELSSLELTPSRGSDGRLTVYEIFNLQLDADLVTLSACDTGLGKEVSGEGVVGMTRAFFYAGARSLVVSLWPVVDRSTSNLMFDFYRYLGDSEEKAQALRRAKLAMIQSGKYAEPYYWAPFVLSGEPR